MTLDNNKKNSYSTFFELELKGTRTFKDFFLSEVNGKSFFVASFIKNNKEFYKYHTLPKFIIIKNVSMKYFSEKDNNLFLLNLKINCVGEFYLNKFELFKKSINNFFLKITKIYQKRLIIKGLGYRLDYKLLDKEAKIYDKNILEYKLGYSHSIYVPMNVIPQGINFRFKTRKKSTLIHLQGLNNVYIGNYARIITNLRQAHVYKEKGINIKYNVIKLRLIKKK